MSIQVNSGKRVSLSEQVQLKDAKLAELLEENAVFRAASSEVARLREQLAEMAELRDQVTKLTKERDDSKNSCKWSDERARNAENELEQAHAVLDGVQGAPTREYEQEYGRGRRNVVTRLAGAFLAIAQKGV